jgi:hypothetical protein
MTQSTSDLYDHYGERLRVLPPVFQDFGGLVDGGGSPRCALMGDLIAGQAVTHGWEGVVIYGRVSASWRMRTASYCWIRILRLDIAAPVECLDWIKLQRSWPAPRAGTRIK